MRLTCDREISGQRRRLLALDAGRLHVRVSYRRNWRPFFFRDYGMTGFGGLGVVFNVWIRHVEES